MTVFRRIFLSYRRYNIPGDSNIDHSFTNCALFSTYKTEINDLFKQNKCTEFETESIKSSVFDYFDTFTLIAGDIIVKAGQNAHVAFGNCALFSTCGSENKDRFKQSNSSILETECINSSLWDNFDAFILVAGDITVSADNNADVAFTNYSPFSTCKKPINICLNKTVLLTLRNKVLNHVFKIVLTRLF